MSDRQDCLKLNEFDGRLAKKGDKVHVAYSLDGHFLFTTGRVVDSTGPITVEITQQDGNCVRWEFSAEGMKFNTAPLLWSYSDAHLYADTPSIYDAIIVHNRNARAMIAEKTLGRSIFKKKNKIAARILASENMTLELLDQIAAMMTDSQNAA